MRTQAVVEALLRRDEDRLWRQRQLAATCALSVDRVGIILADLHGLGRVLLSGSSEDQNGFACRRSEYVVGSDRVFTG